MERLTNKLKRYIDTYQKPPFGMEVQGTVELLQEVVGKLKEYEDLEEQGLLLKLPCKVGDRLWIIISDFLDIESQIISSIIIGKNNDTITFKNHSCFTIWNKDYHEYFGKTVFLTKAEAEEALKRLEGENEQ